MTRPGSVLLHVMTQDPSVVAGDKHPLNPVQPVVAQAAEGFWEGPACERVAVVDISVADGSMRPLAAFDPKGSPYKNVAMYRVATPSMRGAGALPWARGSDAPTPLEELANADYDNDFLKVSVFGTVIRTIAFVEDPVVLGRRVEWAFPGRQILIVPRAGSLDNAFYHRPSRSLQFFSFESPRYPDRTIHTALSQDIVTHETTHALIDGIARDLYDAVHPESLAIHESVADVTASMISLRNRDASFRHRPTPEAAVAAMVKSSRYSRVAEEFGHSRTNSAALRDAINDRTLNPRARNAKRVVDTLSPHSLSEVLTGALFAVLVRSVGVAATLPLPLKGEADTFRAAANHAINRVGSLIYKGLDWLPPGEVTLADFARAMLVADTFHHPERPDERTWLIDECVRRCITTRSELALAGNAPPNTFDIEIDRLVEDKAFARKFVTGHRELFGVPPGPVAVAVRRSVRTDQPLLQRRHVAEIVPLDRAYPEADGVDSVVLVKVAWWDTQPIGLPDGFPDRCDVKCGATLALDDGGRVRALLHGSPVTQATPRRDAYLRRLVDTGTLVAPGHGSGPDGEPLRGSLQATLRDGALRVSGPFQALHIADAT